MFLIQNRIFDNKSPPFLFSFSSVFVFVLFVFFSCFFSSFPQKTNLTTFFFFFVPFPFLLFFSPFFSFSFFIFSFYFFKNGPRKQPFCWGKTPSTSDSYKRISGECFSFFSSSPFFFLSSSPFSFLSFSFFFFSIFLFQKKKK